MSKPAVLVLAATRYQVPFIVRAREMGWREVTLDNNPDNPGHALADSSYYCSTTDESSVLRVAQQERVDGILAACTDVALLTASRVAESLGLPGLSAQSVEILGSKAAFRTFQARARLPHPLWQAVKPGERATGLKGARLFKPDRGSGSRGLTCVEAAESAEGLIEQAAAASANGMAVVEEPVEGFHVTVEGLWDGRGTVLALVTERLLASRRHPATRGHRVPSGLSREAEAESIRSAEMILAELKLGPCVYDMDAVVDGTGTCVVLELAPRAGGNCLTRLMEAVLGYDWIGAVLHLALGVKPLAPCRRAAPAGLVEILGAPHLAQLDYDPGAPQHLKSTHPWLVAFDLDAPRGAIVPERVDGRTRCGEVVLTAATRQEAEDRLAWVLGNARLNFLPLTERSF